MADEAAADPPAEAPAPADPPAEAPAPAAAVEAEEDDEDIQPNDGMETSEIIKLIGDWPLFLDSQACPRNVIFAVRFGSKGANALFLTDTGNVLSLGSNERGCLGIGDTEAITEPKKVDALCKQNVTSIAVGNDLHVMATTEDGRIFAWGCNESNNLGNGNTDAVLVPQLCKDLQPHKIQQVACGQSHTVALTSNQQVFAWGHNGYGQVGNGTTENQTAPVHVKELPEARPIKSIGCTRASSFAMSTCGELFSWGHNGNGELGNATLENKSSPVRVIGEENMKVKMIACGYEHILALSVCGFVYAWGKNDKGQLGVGNTENVNSPKRVSVADLSIEGIAASVFSNLSAVRTICFKIFVWGDYKGVSVLKPRLTSCKSLNEAFLSLSCESITCEPLKSGAVTEDGDISPLCCLIRHVDNEEVSNVQFFVEEKIILGHVSFLRMRSHHMKEILEPVWDGNHQEIVVEDKSYNVYYAYLKFLYTGKLDVEPDDAMALLALADEYCEEALKALCEIFILDNVNVDNVFVIYAKAKELYAQKLEDYTFKFAVHHLTEVSQTEGFLRVDSTVHKDFFHRAGRMDAFKN